MMLVNACEFIVRSGLHHRFDLEATNEFFGWILLPTAAEIVARMHGVYCLGKIPCQPNMVGSAFTMSVHVKI